MRENISPVREQRRSSETELFLSLVREDRSTVRVATKTGKKLQGESNSQKKRKKIKPSEKFFNQHA